MEIGERGEFVQGPYEGKVFFPQSVDVERRSESEVCRIAVRASEHGEGLLGDEGRDGIDMKFSQVRRGQELACLGNITTLVDDGKFFEMREKDGLGGCYLEDAFTLARERNEVGGLSHDLSEFSLSEGA